MTSRIAEIKARAEAATPGPWDDKLTAVYKDETAIRICGEFYNFDADAFFVAQARQDIPYLLSQLAERDKEIERLHRFKEYFDELYGQGLEVANWHLNGNTEPFDSFYDSAVEYMNDPLPAAPEEGAEK